MGKLQEYSSGRYDGLMMALKLVKSGGIEVLEEEIKFRGKTGINTALCQKELEQACVKIKEMTLDTMIVIAVATLHDEFGFGKARLKRFIDRMVLKTECMLDQMATWEDYIQVIQEETGLGLKIRWND